MRRSFSRPSSFGGFTTIELLIVVGLISTIIASTVGYFNMHKNFPKGRDQNRLTGIAAIDLAINQYKLDNNAYPGVSGVLYKSTQLPANSDDLSRANHGWIDANLSTYTSKLYIDPINDATYFFSYTHNGNTYELNAVLENLTQEMANDGGSNSNVYEIGNNLHLILP